MLSLYRRWISVTSRVFNHLLSRKVIVQKSLCADIIGIVLLKQNEGVPSFGRANCRNQLAKNLEHGHISHALVPHQGVEYLGGRRIDFCLQIPYEPQDSHDPIFRLEVSEHSVTGFGCAVDKRDADEKDGKEVFAKVHGRVGVVGPPATLCRPFMHYYIGEGNGTIASPNPNTNVHIKWWY
jgi:hypothetical protein